MSRRVCLVVMPMLGWSLAFLCGYYLSSSHSESSMQPSRMMWMVSPPTHAPAVVLPPPPPVIELRTTIPTRHFHHTNKSGTFSFTCTNMTNTLAHPPRFPRNSYSGVEPPLPLSSLLPTTTHHNPWCTTTTTTTTTTNSSHHHPLTNYEFQALLDSYFSPSTQSRYPPLPFPTFACLAQCPVYEPELERTVRDLRMAEHGAYEHVVSYCKRKIVPIIVYIDAKTHQISYGNCLAGENSATTGLDPAAKDLLLDALKLIKATLALVAIPSTTTDFVFGFDPSDFATPTHGAPSNLFQYVQPMNGIVRFVGTKAHPGLLFPTTSHVVAMAHCDFRQPTRWWRICTAHQDLRDSLPFQNRSLPLMWRGLPTGTGWSAKWWRFNQRARLVREFGTQPGFDVGFVRPMDKKIFTETTEGKQAAIDAQKNGEWVNKPHILKQHHPYHAHLIHVDGNTASWGLSHKLASGSAVFWVESDHDYREFFYNVLEPWKHYIPVTVDMSDLQQARIWALERRDAVEGITIRMKQLMDERLRAQNLYCYVGRLLLSIAKAQVRGKETVSKEGIKAKFKGVMNEFWVQV